MKCLLLVIFLYSILTGEGRKLTEEENEKRLEVCGLYGKQKVFNGRQTNVNEAPWSVMVRTSKGDHYGHCTGTLLSPRTARRNRPSNFVVTEVTASKVTVLTQTNTEFGRAKYLIMFHFCRRIVESNELPLQFPDDFMIIELSEDVEYSTNLQPACLARDPTDNKLETELDFFGYGDNPPVGVPKSLPDDRKLAKLLYHKIRVFEMNAEGMSVPLDPRIFFARSVTSTTISCPGDSGGGAIRKIEGRNTVVGVVMRGTCESMIRGKDGFEIFASVGFYSQDICDITGICNPPRSYSNRNSLIIIFLISVFSFSTMNEMT